MVWGDGVKLGLAFLAVFAEEVLQLVNEAICVAGNSLIQSQGVSGVGKAGSRVDAVAERTVSVRPLLCVRIDSERVDVEGPGFPEEG